jgi:A/G-specific adenine glycosylase
MSDRKQSFRSAPPLIPPRMERVRRINKALLRWGPVRKFPWRDKQPSPFQMLIAESLLARTRAEAVAKVIEEMWRRFPSASALASAPVEHIAEVIAPLGLRKRAEMLRTCAKDVENNGGVPKDRAALLRMSGVGGYVADAVRVFAFSEPVIPVDAVIGRVLRRLMGYQSYGPAYADRSLWGVAQRFAVTHDPRQVTAALLDLGALICLPERPRCSACPLKRCCVYGSERLNAASVDFTPK